MLIPLICKQCGGKLEVEDTQVSVSGDTVMVLPNHKFECPHCGTRYISGDTNKYAPARDGSVSIGSLSIGGDVRGNFVIGNAVGTNPLSETKQQTKKWWEFWK